MISTESPNFALNARTAADVIDGLTAQGYNVQINGTTPVPLSTCTATGIHPTLDDTATLEQKQHTLVTVDVSCPLHC